MVEEVGEHFAVGEGGEEVGFVAFNDGGAFIPEVIAVEEDVVESVTIAAVGTCGVVTGVHSKAGGICGVEGVSSDELERG